MVVFFKYRLLPSLISILTFRDSFRQVSFENILCGGQNFTLVKRGYGICIADSAGIVIGNEPQGLISTIIIRVSRMLGNRKRGLSFISSVS